MFFDATPESKLKREIQNVWDETELKIKVMEKSGIRVNKSQIVSAVTRTVRLVPTRRSVVKIEKLYTPFRVVRAKIKRGFYSEETARSVRENFKEHIVNYESKTKSKYEGSALYTSIEHHNGRKVGYKFKIVPK